MSRKVSFKASEHNGKLAANLRTFKLVKMTNPRPTDVMIIGTSFSLEDMEKFIKNNRSDTRTVIEIVGE